jgi:hypothetical protein
VSSNHTSWAAHRSHQAGFPPAGQPNTCTPKTRLLPTGKFAAQRRQQHPEHFLAQATMPTAGVPAAHHNHHQLSCFTCRNACACLEPLSSKHTQSAPPRRAQLHSLRPDCHAVLPFTTHKRLRFGAPDRLLLAVHTLSGTNNTNAATGKRKHATHRQHSSATVTAKPAGVTDASILFCCRLATVAGPLPQRFGATHARPLPSVSEGHWVPPVGHQPDAGCAGLTVHTRQVALAQQHNHRMQLIRGTSALNALPILTPSSSCKGSNKHVLWNNTTTTEADTWQCARRLCAFHSRTHSLTQDSCQAHSKALWQDGCRKPTSTPYCLHAGHQADCRMQALQALQVLSQAALHMVSVNGSSHQGCYWLSTKLRPLPVACHEWARVITLCSNAANTADTCDTHTQQEGTPPTKKDPQIPSAWSLVQPSPARYIHCSTQLHRSLYLHSQAQCCLTAAVDWK